MRFAPPKSAPPGSRKSAKETENEHLWSSVLSGWSIKPENHDVSLLNECISSVPKRCSSATDRYSSSEPLIINFRRLGNRPNPPEISGHESSRSHSKDSGVDGLTDSGVDSMDSVTKHFNAEEDEFSDISDTDSMLSEEDVAIASTEEEVIMSVTISSSNLLLTDSVVSPRGLVMTEGCRSSRVAHSTSCGNLVGNETSSGNLLGNKTSSGNLVANHSSGNLVANPSSGNLIANHSSGDLVANHSSADLLNEIPTTTSLQREPAPDVPISRTSLENNAFKPRNKREVRREVVREHKVPTSITPDKPEVSTPPKQPPWSRTKKLERHSTTPSMCSYTDMVYDGNVKKEANPESYLPNPFEYLLPANRPRPEKRRSSLGVKSSCSIPSFSTPSQALLLIGMQPDKPAQPRQRKSVQSKPPLIRRHRDSNSFELPALSVNGAGDLVIRKKHIISG